MSESERVSPPVDAQADLSARDRAEVDMAAERANLEAAILRFNPLMQSQKIFEFFVQIHRRHAL